MDRDAEFVAVIEDVRERERREGQAIWQMLLSETLFQEGDSGTLTATARSGAQLMIEVQGVERDAAGALWHRVAKPLAQGTEVTGRVLWRPGTEAS